MKKILVNLIVFALILGITTSTYAFSVSVNSSANEVRTNNQVTLEVNFEENVVTTDFVVKYDTSKFKFVKTNTEGTEVNNIESSGEIVVCFYDMSKVGTDSIELVFESREEEGIGAFELSDITGHTNRVQLSKEGSAIIKNISINNGEDNVDSSNTITSTTGGRDDIDTTVSNSALPNTGAKVSIVLGVAILIVGIIALKYRNGISNKSKGIFSVLLIAGIFVSTNNALALNLFNIKVDESNKVVVVESFVGSVLEKENLEEALDEEISNGKIATGLNVKENYSLVIYGDVNKDGKINSSDIYEIINSNVRTLDKVQKIAANVHNSDELDVNENDIKVIEKYILRLDNLVLKNTENGEEETPSTPDEEVTDGETEETPSTPDEEVTGGETEETPTTPDAGDNSDEIQPEEPSTPGEEGTDGETEETPTTPDEEVTDGETEETPTTPDEEVTDGETEETPATPDEEVTGGETEETPTTPDEGNTEEETQEPTEEPRDPICRRIVKEITYSNTNITWENVTVVVTATEELGETEGWTLSEDKMSVSKTYTMNTVEKVKIYAANGDYEEIKVTILNIWDLGQEDDIEDLTASIHARNKDGLFGSTYGSVIVTITTNNPVKCPEGWTKASSDGTKIQKEYTENTEEVVKLTDDYGSKLVLEISVTNILVAVEEVILSTPYTTDENGVYLVNITDEDLLAEFGFTVNTTINPTNASNKSLDWTITDENGNEIDYATIENGVVKFATKTVSTTYGDYVFTEEVLDDSVAVGNKFIITAKTQDVSEIETSITCSLEAAPTEITLLRDNIYLFMNGDPTKVVGEEDYYVLDDMGSIAETITNQIYQSPDMNLEVKVYPENTTINNTIQYRIVKETEEDVFVEDTTGYATIEDTIITGLMNTGTADNIYVEAYTGENGEIVDRAKLHVYTTPESVAILNSDDEEITSLTMSTNTTNTVKLKAKLSPDTVSTEYESSYITWSIDNTDVLQLPDKAENNTLELKAVGTGTANLILTASNGKSVTIPVTVGVDVKSIEIDPKTATLENGAEKESKKLSVIFTPEDYTGDREIEWTTSNSAQVTVDENGIVTAVANTGNTPVTITATLKSNPEIKAEAKISVANVPTSLTLTKSAETIYVNSNGYNKAKITATIDEASTVSSSQPIYWSSSDTSIVTVATEQISIGTGNTEGSVEVTAVRSGTATITAWTAGTEGSKKTATIDITVMTDPSGVASIVKTYNLVKGNSVTIIPTYTPLNADHNTEITYTSNDTAVATVSSAGVITAVAEGSTNISMQTANGKTATISVKVIDELAADTFEYMQESVTVPAGNADTPTLLKGSDLTDTVTYESSNTEVATVDTTGKITSIKKGTATVTAKCGEKTATINITVYDYATTATVKGSANVTLKYNNTESNTKQLEVTVANEAAVTWYSSNTKVATVNSDGLVTAKSGGTCKIYAVPPSENPTIATWNVTVQVSPASIKLTTLDDTNTIVAGETKEIKVTYSDGTNTDKKIEWTPLADGIIESITASEDQTDVYVVKALDTITAETNISIKAETANGKTATITLKVVPATTTDGGVSTASFNARVATNDFVSNMLTKVRATAQKTINYVEIENSKLFDVTENNNYYAIINENSETKLVKIVDGQKLENSITINTSNIVDIEAVEENVVNVVVRENETTLEILKIDFEKVEILERYKVYTENEENVENTLVNLNEKENQLTVLTTNEEKTEIKIYTLSEVKNAELSECEAVTLTIAKGTEESSFNKYEIKAFTVKNNKIHLVEEDVEAYLTVFTAEGNIEMLNEELDKTNIESIVVTDSDIFVGI